VPGLLLQLPTEQRGLLGREAGIGEALFERRDDVAAGPLEVSRVLVPELLEEALVTGDVETGQRGLGVGGGVQPAGEEVALHRGDERVGRQGPLRELLEEAPLPQRGEGLGRGRMEAALTEAAAVLGELG